MKSVNVGASQNQYNVSYMPHCHEDRIITLVQLLQPAFPSDFRKTLSGQFYVVCYCNGKFAMTL